MRKILVLVLATAIVPTGIAVAQSNGLKVTGGGQVLLSSGSGAGNTIAFNAQQTGPTATDGAYPAKGQLQVINRQAGTGQSQEKFHGVVTCIREFTQDGGQYDGQRFVRFGGFKQERGQTTATPFTVDAQDNGEGLNATGADMIFFRQRSTGDNPCDDSDVSSDFTNTALARGNVQEH